MENVKVVPSPSKILIYLSVQVDEGFRLSEFSIDFWKSLGKKTKQLGHCKFRNDMALSKYDENIECYIGTSSGISNSKTHSISEVS